MENIYKLGLEFGMYNKTSYCSLINSAIEGLYSMPVFKGPVQKLGHFCKFLFVSFYFAFLITLLAKSTVIPRVIKSPTG